MSSFERKFVTISAKAEETAGGDVAEITVVSKILAGKDVAQVNFDERDADGKQSIAYCNAGMRESTRIEQDEVHLVRSSLLYPIDDLVLGIALKALQFISLLSCEARQPALDLGQFGLAIDARLATAEELQVRSVYQQ